MSLVKQQTSHLLTVTTAYTLQWLRGHTHIDAYEAECPQVLDLHIRDNHVLTGKMPLYRSLGLSSANGWLVSRVKGDSNTNTYCYHSIYQTALCQHGYFPFLLLKKTPQHIVFLVGLFFITASAKMTELQQSTSWSILWRRRVLLQSWVSFCHWNSNWLL